MSKDAKHARRFLCALFATVVRPISDLRLLISGLFVLLFALSVPADAQQQAKVRTIGWLGTRPASGPGSGIEALRRGLHALGWVEGKNMFSSTDTARVSSNGLLPLLMNWFVSKLM